MKKPSHHLRSSRRRGVAILIVVGLMAILFISTVAFTIMMRTERSASGSYRQQVASRQLLHAGLMQAIADMAQDQTNLGNANGYLGWQFTYNNTVLGVHVSTENPAAPPGVSAHILSADLMKFIPANLQNAVMSADPHWIYVDPAETGIPVGRYAYLAVNVSSLLDANVVFNPATNRCVGADPGEIQLDPSILWDLDTVSAFTNDRNANISYGSLKELEDWGTNGLYADIISHFETFSYAPVELAPDQEPDLGDGITRYYPKMYIGGDLESRMGSIFNTNDPVANQLTYGDRLTNTTHGILWQPDMMNYREMNNANAAEVTNRVNGFVNSLLDYISTNTLQRHGFGYPTTKNVPMLTWVGWKPFFSFTATPSDGPPPTSTNYDFTCLNQFSFAAYCPPTADTTSSHYQATITIVGNGSQPSVLPTMGSVAQKNALKTAFANVTLSVATPANPIILSAVVTNSAYWLIGRANYTTNFTVSSPVYPSSLGFTFGSPGGAQFMVVITNTVATPNVAVECVPAMMVHLSHSAAAVGGDDYPGTPGTFLPGIAGGLPAGNNVNWAEAMDPRINWDTCMVGGAPVTHFNALPHWTDSGFLRTCTYPGYNIPTLTISAPSWNTLYGVQFTQHPNWLSAPQILNNTMGFDCVGNRSGTGAWNDPQPDHDNANPPWFFVANRPLQSVGELGYLPLDYWQTVRLYTHQDVTPWYTGGLPDGFHRVLDYFTMTPPTNTARHGLINMNTFDPAIWGTLINQMPLDENFTNYMAVAPKPPLTATIANSVGTNIASYFISQSFPKLADFGKIPFLYLTNCDSSLPTNVTFGAATEIEREAVIRNTAGLLTTRQQIMTIIVEADTLSTAYGWIDTSHASVQGSTMGVFQVWRDSQPDPTDNAKQQHPFFIRMYKVMTR